MELLMTLRLKLIFEGLLIIKEKLCGIFTRQEVNIDY